MRPIVRVNVTRLVRMRVCVCRTVVFAYCHENRYGSPPSGTKERRAIVVVERFALFECYLLQERHDVNLIFMVIIEKSIVSRPDFNRPAKEDRIRFLALDFHIILRQARRPASP